MLVSRITRVGVPSLLLTTSARPAPTPGLAGVGVDRPNEPNGREIPCEGKRVPGVRVTVAGVENTPPDVRGVPVGFGTAAVFGMGAGIGRGAVTGVVWRTVGVGVADGEIRLNGDCGAIRFALLGTDGRATGDALGVTCRFCRDGMDILFPLLTGDDR